MNDKRVSAKAMCPVCSWSARMTADTVLEVATFLRALVIAHVETLHPETVSPQIVLEREA